MRNSFLKRCKIFFRRGEVKEIYWPAILMVDSHPLKRTSWGTPLLAIQHKVGIAIKLWKALLLLTQSYMGSLILVHYNVSAATSYSLYWKRSSWHWINFHINLRYAVRIPSKQIQRNCRPKRDVTMYGNLYVGLSNYNNMISFNIQSNCLSVSNSNPETKIRQFR